MNGPDLYLKAKTLIPGGTQLLSKRPELFLPEKWPAYYSRANGAEVVDLDGRTFTDMSIMGVGACVLGYADPDVEVAVIDAVKAGNQCTLNSPQEVELAEKLIELHPWADMVRYARSGGEAMSMAVRIARASSGKDVVAFSGYHGWTDWYLAANLGEDSALDGHLMPGLQPAGVPRSLAGSAYAFHYNEIEELEEIARRANGKLGVIVIEPRRSEMPKDGFLEKVRKLADREGAVLIFDEITTGWRMCSGGIHKTLGVNPDIAVFAKAMANGYAISAVLGRREVMDAAQTTFISSTNWTERIGPAAALATIKKYADLDVNLHINKIGDLVTQGWLKCAESAGLEIDAHHHGLASLAHFSFKHPDEIYLSTIFVDRMLDRGWLAFTQFKPSYAHKESHVERYLQDCEAVFEELCKASKAGDIKDQLKSPLVRRGFARLTS
jgi:glutamate-1-semialdehyde aminotransferase